MFVGKSEVKRPLTNPRHRYKNFIRINVKDKGWVGMDRLISLTTGSSGGLSASQN